MRAFVAFTKKEFCEITRTYKLFIMLTIFFLIGMMNPITAKITPVLIKEYMPKGMQITIPEPTALDSWAQFFKNVPEMGMVVLVIVFSGMMANEFSRNTLINILTKGLRRSVVILSKFTMAAFIWTISYTICFVVSYGYTVYFWSNDRVSNIFFSVFCLWLFGILLIATMMLGGVLIKSNYACLLFTGVFVVILFLVNIIPKLQDYNPIILASKNMALLTAELSVGDFIKSIVICCILSIIFLVSAVSLFNKKQL
jgi:ABC-2 type transport system permease protein